MQRSPEWCHAHTVTSPSWYDDYTV